MLNGFDMGAYEVQEISDELTIESFTANPTSGAVPLSVNFTCIARDNTHGIKEYIWNFGDSTTFTTATGTALHTYTIPGIFAATCTVVSNSNQQLTTTTAVEATNEIPIASAGPDQIIPGKTVNLNGGNSNDPDGTIVSWEWTLDRVGSSFYDRTATGETPTVTNLKYGNYIVTLTVTDNYGGTGTDEMNLCVAASDAEFTQADLDKAYNDGYTAGQSNCTECPIREDANGNKFLYGPLTIENKGSLTIQ
jgi:PKD repeat protein